MANQQVQNDFIPVEYDLASSISDLTNMITSRAREKNLNLFVNVNDQLPHMLFGDEIRIKQCVLNLFCRFSIYLVEFLSIWQLAQEVNNLYLIIINNNRIYCLLS